MSTPTVGVHRGIPAHEYHRWPALSNSAMTPLSQSPAHYRAWKDAPQPDAAHFIVGRATHAAILEPDVFGVEFVRGIEGDKRTKLYREQMDELAEAHPNATIVPAPDYDAACAMRDAVWSHPRAQKLLEADGDAELSLVWDDLNDIAPVLCKARIDRVTNAIAGGTVLDVKTTRDASEHAFRKAVADYGYYRQAGHYLNGCDALGVEARHFCIIAVEKTPPYAVALWLLDREDIDLGRREARQLIRLYATCKQMGRWPAYKDTIEPLKMSDWAWKQIDERMRPHE